MRKFSLLGLLWITGAALAAGPHAALTGMSAAADDASTAGTNPAGMTQLIRPEFSIEARNWDHVTPYSVSGRVEGLPSGFGIDTTVGLREALSGHDVTGIARDVRRSPAGPESFERRNLARHVRASTSPDRRAMNSSRGRGSFVSSAITSPPKQR